MSNRDDINSQGRLSQGLVDSAIEMAGGMVPISMAFAPTDPVLLAIDKRATEHGFPINDATRAGTARALITLALVDRGKL